MRCHIARSKPDFRTKIVSIEKKIKDHEALGKFLNSSENHNICLIISQYETTNLQQDDLKVCLKPTKLREEDETQNSE